MSTALRARPVSRSTRRSHRPIAVVVVGALLAGAALLGVALWPRSHGDSPPVPIARFTALAVGERAPQMQLANAGANGARTALPAVGRPTLIAFLATQPDSSDTPSRSQAVEVVSLTAQYAAKGLRVEIVDDTATPAGTSALENTVYDWQLGSLPLLADPAHVAANRYGITSAPTTLLIGRDGTVIERWNGYVLSAVAAQAVSSALATDSAS